VGPNLRSPEPSRVLLPVADPPSKMSHLLKEVKVFLESQPVEHRFFVDTIFTRIA